MALRNQIKVLEDELQKVNKSNTDAEKKVKKIEEEKREAEENDEKANRSDKEALESLEDVKKTTEGLKKELVKYQQKFRREEDGCLTWTCR